MATGDDDAARLDGTQAAKGSGDPQALRIGDDAAALQGNSDPLQGNSESHPLQGNSESHPLRGNSESDPLQGNSESEPQAAPLQGNSELEPLRGNGGGDPPSGGMTTLPWPADAVERRPTQSLVPYARNARTHSAAQVEQIAASMREFGFTIPVLVDEQGVIIAGHGRILAADKLGYETVPVMVARGWTAAQIKAYRIADNKIALNSGWDLAMLAEELAGLADLVSLTGFSEDELLALAAPPPQAELPDTAEAKRTLAERFMLPPFTVMNAREGWWQERKRAWIGLGIESELGRGENLIGRSIFDGLFILLGSDYPATKAYVERHRAEGKTDEQIVEIATAEFGPLHGAPGRKANGRTAARTFGQDLMRGEHVVGAKTEKVAVMKGEGWTGGPARRDAAFYAKKRAWEKANGRKISTPEFREKYWDGQA